VSIVRVKPVSEKTDPAYGVKPPASVTRSMLSTVHYTVLVTKVKVFERTIVWVVDRVLMKTLKELPSDV